MNQALDSRKLAALIDWYRLAGIDTFIADGPVDRFALAAEPPPLPVAGAIPPHGGLRDDRGPQTAAASPPAPSAPTAAAPLRPGATSVAAALAEARERTAAAASLEALRASLAGFDGCQLKQMAKNLCFADGNATARLMLVGEAPGRDEDLAGVPFVGPAGQLLDRMLAAAGLDRKRDVWITNTVFWRPPGNRVPSNEEIEVCRPFLERQIELLQPAYILALGGAAAKQLLGTTSGIMRLRGKWQEIEVAGRTYEVLPTLHPAFLLRNASAKKLAWRDLLTLLERLETESRKPPQGTA